jgi:phosphatidylserine/phosphatidylglycerophosphate/cardiolipin synthase-like enzyme
VIVGAIKKAAAAGVDVRIAYDHTKASTSTPTIKGGPGNDPAPRGTDVFVRANFPASTKVQTRPIAGSNLMHNKYVIRDGETVWTGSANFTEGAWSLQENNILRVHSAELSAHYEKDFQDLWTSGNILHTGANAYGTVQIDGRPVEVAFAPGTGSAVASLFVDAIQGAGETILISTMVLSSGPILGALFDHLRKGGKLQGVFDGTQMAGVEKDWQPKGKPASPKLALWQAIKPHLHCKTSTPFSDNSPHDFMHNKTLVTDDVLVTGSFNLSRNAESNSENALAIRDPDLVKAYKAYIDQITKKYPPAEG